MPAQLLLLLAGLLLLAPSACQAQGVDPSTLEFAPVGGDSSAGSGASGSTSEAASNNASSAGGSDSAAGGLGGAQQAVLVPESFAPLGTAPPSAEAALLNGGRAQDRTSEWRGVLGLLAGGACVQKTR